MPSVIGTPVFKNSDGTSSSTQAYTVPATGGNRALVVQLSMWDNTNPDITGVTYNGVALTKIAEAADGSGSDFVECQAWILLDPPTGSSLDVVVTAGASLSTFRVCISSWENVQQSTPTVTGVDAAAGGSASPYGPGALTTTVDDVVIVTVDMFRGTSYTLNTVGTTLFVDSPLSGNDDYYFYYVVATTTSTNADFTTSGGNLEQNCILSFVLEHDLYTGGGSEGDTATVEKYKLRIAA